MTELLNICDSFQSSVFSRQSSALSAEFQTAQGAARSVGFGAEPHSNKETLRAEFPSEQVRGGEAEGVWGSIPHSHKIATETRTWLGTPFRHQGRLKGVGCDCLGLLIGVAEALDLQDKNGNSLAAFGEQHYGHYPDETHLRQQLEAALHPVNSIAEGHIGLFKIDGRAQHLGIFAETTLIHAYAPARKVVEHRMSQEWHNRLVAVFAANDSND